MGNIILSFGSKFKGFSTASRKSGSLGKNFIYEYKRPHQELDCDIGSQLCKAMSITDIIALSQTEISKMVFTFQKEF